MYTKQEIIIQYYREGKSQRSISEELGISRKTVRKYISQYEAKLKGSNSPENALSECLTEAPAYSVSAPRPKRKLTREVQGEIDKFLAAKEEKKAQGLRKQLLKNCDIHELLCGQGFDIRYTTVSEYIKNRVSATKPKEAFIRQQYQPGELCEFDWGEVKLYIGDEQAHHLVYECICQCIQQLPLCRSV